MSKGGQVAERAKAPQVSYLKNAAETYREAIDRAIRELRYADSALTVLQREIDRLSDSKEQENALFILSEASRSAADLIAGVTRHERGFKSAVQYLVPAEFVSDSIMPDSFSWSAALKGSPPAGLPTIDLSEAYKVSGSVKSEIVKSYIDNFCTFTTSLPSKDYWVSSVPVNELLTGCFYWPKQQSDEDAAAMTGLQSALSAATDAVAGATQTADTPNGEAYWRRLRDELQQRLSLSLEILASILDVAKPTLVNLGKRRPHPSTARAVLRLHAVTEQVVRNKSTAGQAWLSEDGVRILTQRGFNAFKRAAYRDLYPRTRQAGGVGLFEEPELHPPTTSQDNRVE